MPAGNQLKLRLLTKDDFAFANELRALAGWNQTLDDWQRFLACETNGCFVAEWEGKPVGTATTITYGQDLAWIGMVLVHPEQRRRGIGKALLLHCIEYLQQRGIACIKLDATPLGKPLYDTLGFKDEWTLQRWEATYINLPATPIQYHVRPWRDEDHEIIRQLDGEAFGADRWRMLARLSWQISRPIVHESPVGRVNGFGFVRAGMKAIYLGPVVAEAAPVAGATIKALLAAIPESRIFWDIPDHQTEMVELAKRLGFVPQRPLVRMYLGENKTPGNPQHVFAISAPETG